MALVTIITPTYNRSHLLTNLYESLKKQKLQDFEWLIVDDGSSDKTREIVQHLQQETIFPIRYIYKNNGGKHTALNVGIKTICSPLTMIVDSDDTLLPNAIQTITEIHAKYKDESSVGAYSFLRCYADGRPVLGLNREEFVDSYIKYRIKENRPGDMAEVFKTHVLQEYPFPEFKEEKFLSEDVVWIQIGFKYKYVFINKSIYQCEYLTDGLSANDKPMKFASPLGSMMRGKMLMSKGCGGKTNIKGAIIYDCYKKKARLCGVSDKRLELDVYQKILCSLMNPISIYFYKKWKPSRR